MEMELNSRYRINYDRYQFTEAQLTQNLFVDKEAHASAVATAAVIEWQLTHRPEGQLIPFLKVYIALAVLIKYENEVILAIAALVNVPRISLNCCCICANV